MSLNIFEKENLIYTKLLFKYKNSISSIPHIIFVRCILHELPENLQNEDVVYKIYTSIMSNEDITIIDNNNDKKTYKLRLELDKIIL